MSSQSSTIEAKKQMVAELGLADRLQAVVGMDIPVRELTPATARTVGALVASEAAAGAEAVILGCTGFEIGFTAAVRQTVRDAGGWSP